MKRLLSLALLALLARAAAGQGTVAEQLQRAEDAYKKSNTEQAKNIFATISTV